MDKKEEILAKSGELFMRLGIKSVSMDDLAREVGISKKTIYTYFHDKNVLVESVVARKMMHIEGGCAQLLLVCDNAIEELYQVIQFVSENMNVIHPSVFYDLHKYHPNAQKMIDTHEKEYVLPMILANIERGRAEGFYRQDFDAEIVAQIYVSVNDSIFRRTIIGNTHSTITEIFKESLRFILFGMATREGKNYIRKNITHE
jgi:TetR/AcrR family transcriptional regulator, cholesterol catabolism regulator